jgi:hypothetical protein
MSVEKDIITKSDWLAWRDQRITQMCLDDIIERIQNLAADLVQNAGKDQLNDRFQSGKISGLTEIADWQPEFKKDDI